MKCTLLAAVFAWASLSGLAFAQTRDELKIRSVQVHYGDLDLSRVDGAARMLHRIERAASRACGGRPDGRDRQDLGFYRMCVSAAADEAVANLNAPLVTALHRSESHIRTAHTPR
jgi:UrcA family protein